MWEDSPHCWTVPVAVDVGVAVVGVPAELETLVVDVGNGVGMDTLLGPLAHGLPYSRIAWASCAYVHPSLMLLSENPALHIMMPPKRVAFSYSLTSSDSCSGVM